VGDNLYGAERPQDFQRKFEIPFKALLDAHPRDTLQILCGAALRDGDVITAEPTEQPRQRNRQCDKVVTIRHDDGTPAKSLRRTPTVLRALGEAVLGERAGRYPSLGETVVDPAAYRRRGVTDWATGAAMLISADCARACGPWDESFFLYSEETDFALRAGDLGFATAFVPGAEVTHLGGESRVSPALWSLLVVNRVRLYRKRHSAAATAAFWAAVFLRESSRAMLGHRRSRRAVGALLGRPVPQADPPRATPAVPAA